MKTCTTCKETKTTSEFNKDKQKIDNLTSSCKACKKLSYQKKKDLIRAYNKKRGMRNVDIPTNAICGTCKVKKTQSEFNKSRHNLNGLTYNCKECANAINREYYKINRDRKAAYDKSYQTRNREAINARDKVRRQNDPMYKLIDNLRRRTLEALKGNGFKKTSRTQQILGCDYVNLKRHLESQFTPSMSWRNQGIYWQTDHCVPISLGCTKKQILALCHYANLQPLEAKANVSKGNDFVRTKNLLRVLSLHPEPSLIESIVTSSGIKVLDT